MNINVLYIDDEVNNLHSFKAAFRRDFKIFTANNTDTALEILKKETIHVVCSDQRMPNTTGVEFFETIIHSHPKPVRMLLTGYSDIKAVIDAVNLGQVFRYITKPWVEDDLRSSIESAYKVYNLREDKNFFVYKVSHDLKGPLVSIKGLLNLIKKESEQKDTNHYINLIDDSIGRLDDTLTELIEFKRIGEAIIYPEPIDFNLIINSIIASNKRFENFENNLIEVEINEKEPFISDALILKSIAQNLIQNSVRYGRYGDNHQPTVKINVNSDAEKAIIEVQDNGLGMTPDIEKNIFKMFYRGHTEIKGTGLGLYIVKTGLEKLNGEVYVESEPNEGSLFRLTIPKYNILPQ